MKEWTLTGRILFASLAYILSLILFINTSAFSYSDFKTSLITVNIVAFIVMAIGYASSKNVLTPAFFVCMFFCVPSVIAHSKLGEAIFEMDVESKFSAPATAVIFLAVILMLLIAGKLKRMEKEYLSLVSSGAEEEDVKLAVTNSLKVYLAFLAGLSMVTFIVVVIGFIFLNLKGSVLIAVATAVLGMALLSGCALYLTNKWSK